MSLAELNFEDSNLAGIGSDFDAGLRKAAADAEAEFDGAGEAPGMELWRIENFEAKRLSEAEHGTFYSGDAYNVLSTYVVPETATLSWDMYLFSERTAPRTSEALLHT
jgi:gelsolin